MPKSKSTKSRSVLKGRKIKPPKKGKATKSEHMTKRALHGMYKQLKSGERTTSILTPGQVCPRNKRRWDRKKPKSGWPLVSCKKKKIGERAYKKNKPKFDKWVRSLTYARRLLRKDPKLNFPQKKEGMLVYPKNGSPYSKGLSAHEKFQRLLYHEAKKMYSLNTDGKIMAYARAREEKLKGKKGVRYS